MSSFISKSKSSSKGAKKSSSPKKPKSPTPKSTPDSRSWKSHGRWRKYFVKLGRWADAIPGARRPKHPGRSIPKSFLLIKENKLLAKRALKRVKGRIASDERLSGDRAQYKKTRQVVKRDSAGRIHVWDPTKREYVKRGSTSSRERMKALKAGALREVQMFYQVRGKDLAHQAHVAKKHKYKKELKALANIKVPSRSPGGAHSNPRKHSHEMKLGVAKARYEKYHRLVDKYNEKAREEARFYKLAEKQFGG